MCALSSSLIAMNMHIKSPQMLQCVRRKIFYRMHTVNKWKYHIMSLQPKTYSVNQVAVLHLNVIAILETDSNLLIWWITCTSACKLLELAPGRFGIPLHQTSREGKYVEWISNVEESHGFRRMPLVLLFFALPKIQNSWDLIAMNLPQSLVLVIPKLVSMWNVQKKSLSVICGKVYQKRTKWAGFQNGGTRYPTQTSSSKPPRQTLNKSVISWIFVKFGYGFPSNSSNFNALLVVTFLCLSCEYVFSSTTPDEKHALKSMGISAIPPQWWEQ